MEVDYAEEDTDGSIKSIHVRNFFCHDNLEVNLNRNVNFIVGRNGSGKSAILTALVVGLGGRASATNRGNNLHSFIKKGANSATVEIKIKNSSAKAYKHNVYGDYITVVRNINASGGSSYKVKAASGEVISTTAEEVKSIIQAHDIQVDNPISVLNQDDARSFHASDAKKKYALFRKATNLDQTEVNYVKALENCKKATVIWNKKNEACLELEKEYKKWKTSYEQLQSRSEIEVQKRALQNEYYWSEIADFEREAATIQAQYDKQKAKMEKLIEKLSRMEQNFGCNSEAIDTLKAQLDVKTLEKTAVEQELQALESEIRELQSSWRASQSSCGKNKELYNREKRKVADLEREIQNIDSGSAACKRAELEASAAETAEAAAAALARYDTAQHHAAQARAHAAHAQAQRDQLASAARAKRDTLRQLQQQARELQSRGASPLAVFGAPMEQLGQRLQRAAGSFSAPPRGPIGAYLKVKDKKWGGALEHILGGAVRAFCVNTPEDSRKLFEIMNQVYGKAAKPSVTCSKFLSEQHDVRKNKVRAGAYVSALDSLEVADPVVANYLIDNIGMESILLVPDHEDAARLAGSLENVPERCSKIVTLDCSEYHPAPRYRCYGGAARPPRYLHLSTAARLEQVQAEIKETEAALRKIEAQLQTLSEEARQAQEGEAAAARALQALLAARLASERAARAAHGALQLAGDCAPHRAVLLDELRISKEKLQSLQEHVDEYTEREQQYRAKVDACEDSMRRAKKRANDITAACRSLHVQERQEYSKPACIKRLMNVDEANEDEIEQEQLKLDHGKTEHKAYRERINEDQNKLTQVEAILGEKAENIQMKIDEALRLCPRIEKPRDKAVVTNELKKTQLKLNSLRSDGLSKAEVAERLLEVERKYRRTTATLDRLRLLIDQIKNTTDKHLQFCHSVQTYIARRVQHCFQSMLTLRGYSGRMEIDNARGSLEVVCSGRASTASLSGGERSYSTVAFIMALWDCVELPFCFMDEFDVFMDNVNRKIVMELLIDHALKNTSRQFVFLTPQDTSSVTAKPQISIHLMADPRP